MFKGAETSLQRRISCFTGRRNAEGLCCCRNQGGKNSTKQVVKSVKYCREEKLQEVLEKKVHWIEQ